MKKIILIITFVFILIQLVSATNNPQSHPASEVYNGTFKNFTNYEFRANLTVNDTLFGKHGNFTGNLTLADKITFRLGEYIDNLVDGWFRFFGSINMMGNKIENISTINVSTIFADNGTFVHNITANTYFGDGQYLDGVHNSSSEIGYVCTSLYPTGNTTAELTIWIDANRTDGEVSFGGDADGYSNINILSGTVIGAGGVCFSDDGAGTCDGIILYGHQQRHFEIQVAGINDFFILGANGLDMNTNLTVDDKITFDKNDETIDNLVNGVINVSASLYAVDNIIEGTRGQFFAYKTNTFDMPAANTWYDLPWNITAPVKQGFTHTHDGANPEQITVTNAGTYLISYTVHSYYPGVNSHVSARMLADGTEIVGSYSKTVREYSNPISHTFICKLSANDILELQVGTHVAGTDVESTTFAGMPAPTTSPSATISITKLSNDV